MIQRLENEKKAREDLEKRHAQEFEEEKKKGWAQYAKGMFGARIQEKEEKQTDSTELSSEANRHTIGRRLYPLLKQR